MPTIFLALGQFSHFSDVLRGKLLPELAERFRVIVLTQTIDADGARRDGYVAHPNVEYHALPSRHPTFWVLWDTYLRVPFIRTFDHLTYMRYFYRRPHWWPRRILMAARVMFPRSLFTPDRLTRWEQRLVGPNPAFNALVERYRPRLLVTATPGFTTFEAECIVWTKCLGIPSVAVDINYDNLTSNGKMIRKTDYLAVWNALMASEARDLHAYPDERLAVVGCLRFDHYFTDSANPRFPSREAFLRSKGLDPGRKTVVLAGPTPANYPPRRELAATLLALRASGLIRGDPNILIRIHPNDHLDSYRAFMGLPGLAIERAGRKTRPDSAGGQKVEMGESDFFNLTATLRYADVVLNFASTVIMEAAIFDRPVINIAFPDYRRIVYEFEYNKGLLNTGAARLAKDPGELASQINEYLAHPERDREARARLLDRYIPFRDGESFRRTADFIEKIIMRINE